MHFLAIERRRWVTRWQMRQNLTSMISLSIKYLKKLSSLIFLQILSNHYSRLVYLCLAQLVASLHFVIGIFKKPYIVLYCQFVTFLCKSCHTSAATVNVTSNARANADGEKNIRTICVRFSIDVDYNSFCCSISSCLCRLFTQIQ